MKYNLKAAEFSLTMEQLAGMVPLESDVDILDVIHTFCFLSNSFDLNFDSLFRFILRRTFQRLCDAVRLY